MENGKRLDLIDRQALGIGRCNPDAFPLQNRGYCAGWNGVISLLEQAPRVDAVEVSRLGKLGRLMMPYQGCPRGRFGARGCSGDGRADFCVMELDAIVDVDGNRWIPVLDSDLDALKAKAQTSGERRTDG